MTSRDVRVCADREAMSRAAAGLFADVALQAVRERGRFSAALSGGGTPQRTFALLAGPTYREALPWPSIHFFWGDERAVPPEHRASNYAQARRALLGEVGAPPGNVHRMRGELGPLAAAEDYAARLREFAGEGRAWPRFDLALMGLGTDGHTASLFPGPISEDETRLPVVAASAQYEDRPTERVSLTPLVFNDARLVVFLAAGSAKAETLAAVLNGPYMPERWPAQRIRPTDGELIWLVDQAAASRLTG